MILQAVQAAGEIGRLDEARKEALEVWEAKVEAMGDGFDPFDEYPECDAYYAALEAHKKACTELGTMFAPALAKLGGEAPEGCDWDGVRAKIRSGGTVEVARTERGRIYIESWGKAVAGELDFTPDQARWLALQLLTLSEDA